MFDLQEFLRKLDILYQAVHNERGRASCQDDFETFEIMRKSQFLAWDEEVVRSYLTDIEEAERKLWNLLTENMPV